MFKIENKYLTKGQQLKRNFWKGFGVCSVLVVGTVIIYQFLVIPQVRLNTKKVTLADLKEQRVYEYVLNKSIKHGDQIGKDIDINKDVKRVVSTADSVPSNSVVDINKLKGMVARINLSEKTPITTDMFVTLNDYVTQDLRNQDYSDIALSKNLKVGDYVDIRYKKKDGSDFIVVSKKKVTILNNLTAIYNITEDERQYKNNAAVAAALTGGTLYTTIYVDPQNQEAAKVTYVLDNNIQRLIDNDKNVVKQAEQTLQERNQVNGDKPNF